MSTENTNSNGNSLLARLLDGAAEIVKRPFVENRVKRAFATAADSIEEQLMDNEASANGVREALVAAAKTDGSLKSYVQQLVDLQQTKITLAQAKEALAAEKKTFLE